MKKRKTRQTCKSNQKPGHQKQTAGKSAKAMKIPIFHHALLKTSRMQEMIDWYAAVVGIEPVFQAPGIAFLSNDGANHRISMAGGPHFRDNPQFRTYRRSAPSRVRVRRRSTIFSIPGSGCATRTATSRTSRSITA